MLLWIPVVFGFLVGDAINEPNYEHEFRLYIRRHNKNYNPGSEEYIKRFNIFRDSIKRIENLNKLRTHENSALYGVNEYSDLTPDEFESKVIRRFPSYTMQSHENLKRRTRSITYANDLIPKLPDGFPIRVDWRDKKVISEVHNQGKCGACWAYSTIETIEAMVAIKTRKPLVELSVQQVIDCATGDNHGCDGGDTCAALEWMANTRTKLQNAVDYPLRDNAGDCRVDHPKTGIEIYSNFTCKNYTSNEVEIVKQLAYHGPLVAAVDAASWQDYLGGVIQYHCETKRNHAVQIVGFDISGDIPYYIVRNTWGTEFGLRGYLHIAIGNNLCGIAEEISSVDVKV